MRALTLGVKILDESTNPLLYLDEELVEIMREIEDEG